MTVIEKDEMMGSVGVITAVVLRVKWEKCTTETEGYHNNQIIKDGPKGEPPAMEARMVVSVLDGLFEHIKMSKISSFFCGSSSRIWDERIRL